MSYEKYTPMYRILSKDKPVDSGDSAGLRRLVCFAIGRADDPSPREARGEGQGWGDRSEGAGLAGLLRVRVKGGARSKQDNS